MLSYRLSAADFFHTSFISWSDSPHTRCRPILSSCGTPSDLYLLLDLKPNKIITSVLVMAMYFSPISRPWRFYYLFLLACSLICLEEESQGFGMLQCRDEGGCLCIKIGQSNIEIITREKTKTKNEQKGCFQAQT